MSPSHMPSIVTPAILGQFDPVRWTDSVIRCDLSRGANRLAFILSNHFDFATGLCRRNMRTLCAQLGVVTRTVQRYRAELERAGLLFTYQRSRHKCNRFQALMGADVKRPAKPEPQTELDLAPVDQNIKNVARGATPTVTPRTVIRTQEDKIGGRAGAPSGFTERPLGDLTPSPKVDKARSTLRRLGIKGLVVQWLALVCNPHELEWLAVETVTRARNPGRYLRALVNQLTAGTAAPGRRKHAQPPVGFTGMKHPETPAEPTRPAEAIPDRRAPDLRHDPTAWDAAWSSLDDDLQAKGAEAWRTSAEWLRTPSFARGMAHFQRTRRRWLTAWLLDDADHDLGTVASAEAIEDQIIRDEWLGFVTHRSAHMADFPKLYASPEARK